MEQFVNAYRVPVSILHLALVLVLLTACAGRDAHHLLGVEPAEPGAIAGEHRLFVATTRKPAADAAAVFGIDRADALSFARVDVTVPAVHQPGALEKPRHGQARDAARHFAAREIGVYGSQEAFSAALRENLKKTGGRALVFIHGYHTAFDGAVYRGTQIVHDSRYAGTAVLFSWASAGRTLDYIYDNNSATMARDGLEQTLRLLSRSGATRIDIVAHSMGNWVAMEALRQIAMVGDRDIADRLGDVVLAAPDIDVDVFRSQLRRIGKPDRPFFVLLSRDDRALLLSSVIAGNRPRVGDYQNQEDLARLGVIVVDLSAIESGDRLNHAKFADNPLLVQILGERLNEDDAFTGDADQITRRITRLGQGLGTTLGSAAEIVITTPLEVMSIAVGGAGG